jgi:glucose-1-phosphate cytidylyltransferase
MKVVLFCGGLGTRIREYSDSVPKPMIPIGQQPILWHVMQYYCHYGHRDFVLCLGYKSNYVKEYFLNFRAETQGDILITSGPNKFEPIGPRPAEWRIALIETGLWRNIGERLMAVRSHVEGEEMFLANYSDGLTDLNLDAMIEAFKASNKIGCFLAVHPPLTYHIAEIRDDGAVQAFRSSSNSEIWINGGYFIFRREIFDYIKPGEELVLEPFERLIADDQLMAMKYEGFWRSMDTLRDRQVLEDMVDQGRMPWRQWDSMTTRGAAE